MPYIKRHIAVDTQGLPRAVAVSIADVTDRKGLEAHTCECYAVVKKKLTRLLSDVRAR